MSLKAINEIATESLKSTQSNITAKPFLITNFAVTNLAGALSNKPCQCKTNKHQNLYSMKRMEIGKESVRHYMNENQLKHFKGCQVLKEKLLPIGVIPLQKLLD